MPEAKILIVEDEAIAAMDIQHRLTALGYPLPDIAYNGEEGVKKAEEIQPDLVLMDIMMPGKMDGIAAAEQVRSRFDIPVIFLTAYTDENTLRRAKITAPYGYIVKPFQERELHITVDMALYRHKMERELREREKWLATTLRSIGDGVVATDDKGRITFINPVAEAMMGCKLEEVLQKNLTEVFNIVNKDTRKPMENPVSKVIIEGNVVGLANHTILISRDGKEIPINDSAAPIKDDNGNILGVILVFSDMTESEKTAESLHESQKENEFLAGLIRASSQPVGIGYPDGRLGLFNRAFEELTGYTADELRSINWVTALTPPEWLEMEREKLAELHRTGQSVHYEKEYIRKDGTRVPVELLVHVVNDPDGKPQYYYAFLTDLTERKQAEEKVLKLNEELRRNVAGLSVANASLRDSRKATLNIMEDAIEARRQAEETNAELMQEVAERERAEDALRESEGHVRVKLESILSPEGDIGALELRDIIDAPAVQSLMDTLYEFVHLPVGILDLKGKVLVGVGWQAICTEFHRVHPETCRHCAESDLELTRGVAAGEFRLYKCKNGMWDAVTPILVGGQHMGNLFWGQFFFEGELIDREFFRAQARKYGFNEEDYLAALERVPRISRETLDSGMAFYLKLSDMLSKLSYSNIKLARSLSERDALTDSLRESTKDLAVQNLKLEDVNRELEAFIYSVAHDLRAPLRTIAGFAKILTEDNAGQLDTQGRDYLARISQGSAKMSRLIKDLLDLSKISKQELRPMEVDLSRLALNLVSGLREADPGRNVEIIIEDGLKANVDKPLMEIALSNLLDNAWKFTSKTENARIEFGRGLSLFMDEAERSHRIGAVPVTTTIYYVRDNGAGFDPTYKNKMFEPFQRLHLDREFPGTGIGLTIVERIIRRHGGKVWAEGEVGKGTTVYFTLV